MRFPLLAMAAAGVAMIGCVSLEQGLVYQPRPGPFPYEAPPDPIQDVHLLIADGTKVHARWVPHPRAKGAILYCHGNGGNIELWGGAVKKLWQELELAVLIFDYPGYGHSDGKPSEQGCYHAAEAAYRWLVEEARIPAGEIVIYGESLGGGVAVDLAARRPHRALVLVRTFTSVPEVADDQLPFLPVASLMINRFDSLSKIGQCQQPIFLAHGDQDRMIPIRHSQRLHQATTAPGELLVMRGLDHYDPLPLDFYRALRGFLDRPADVDGR